eukprot:3675190-Heterocapsa_arctica.AAC.1
MSVIGPRVAAFPKDARPRSDREAFLELLKLHDLYDGESVPVEPFDPTRLNLLNGTVPSRPMEEQLEGEALDYYNNFATRIEL